MIHVIDPRNHTPEEIDAANEQAAQGLRFTCPDPVLSCPVLRLELENKPLQDRDHPGGAVSVSVQKRT